MPRTFVRKNRVGSTTARELCDSAAKLTTTSVSCSRKRRLGELAVADVALHERDPILDGRQALAISGVREQVVDDELVVRVALEPVVDEVGADEPGSAGDEEAHPRKASRDPSPRGRHEARRASAGGVALRSAALRSTEYAGLGAGRPSSALVIRRTRQSSPASSKIASAKSAQVQSPSAATCQRPKGSSSSTRRRTDAAR